MKLVRLPVQRALERVVVHAPVRDGRDVPRGAAHLGRERVQNEAGAFVVEDAAAREPDARVCPPVVGQARGEVGQVPAGQRVDFALERGISERRGGVHEQAVVHRVWVADLERRLLLCFVQIRNIFREGNV